LILADVSGIVLNGNANGEFWMRFIIPLFAAVMFAGALTPAANGMNETAAREVSLFVVLFHPGPGWRQGEPVMSQEGIEAHVAFMQQLFDDGRLIAGGPWRGAGGGMALLRASSREEAETVMAADPAVTSGLSEIEIMEWRPAFLSTAPIPRPGQ
jgi:uncharacterized protein YciI